MAEDLIRYDILAQDALRGVVRKVLSEASRAGLPGDHHFYVTFATQGPGVRISSRLLAQYPEEMTIVLQHQFWDLTVTEHAFEVALSFNGVSERLLVPFASVKSFLDPSVQFGIQFETLPRAEAEVEPSPTAEPPAPLPAPELAQKEEEKEEPEDAAKGTQNGEAQVVSLDAFRRKN